MGGSEYFEEPNTRSKNSHSWFRIEPMGLLLNYNLSLLVSLCFATQSDANRISTTHMEAIPFLCFERTFFQDTEISGMSFVRVIYQIFRDKKKRK